MFVCIVCLCDMCVRVLRVMCGVMVYGLYFVVVCRLCVAVNMFVWCVYDACVLLYGLLFVLFCCSACGL